MVIGSHADCVDGVVASKRYEAIDHGCIEVACRTNGSWQRLAR